MDDQAMLNNIERLASKAANSDADQAVDFAKAALALAQAYGTLSEKERLEKLNTPYAAYGQTQ